MKEVEVVGPGLSSASVLRGRCAQIPTKTLYQITSRFRHPITHRSSAKIEVDATGPHRNEGQRVILKNCSVPNLRCS